MKRFYLIIIGFLIINVSAIAQVTEEKIIQKCINLAELHQYYLLQPDGIPKYLYAVNNNEVLPDNLNASVFGTKLSTVSMAYIQKNNIKHYFIFKSLNINSLEVEFNLISTDKNLNIQLSFEKSGENWTVLFQSIKEFDHE